MAFNNAGSVNVTQGTLVLNSGGSNSAAINVSGGAAATFSGDNYTHAAGSSLNGPGTINFSATESVADPVAVSAILNITSGTITGAGGLTATGTVNWKGGTIATGGTVIAAGATLNLSGGQVTLQGVLENDGTTNWTSGVIQLSGGTINNNGSWTANSNSTLSAWGGTVGGNAFSNNAAGTFTQQGTGTTQFTTNWTSVAFHNSGVVEAHSGTLDLGSSLSNFDAGSATLTGGTYAVSAAGGFRLPTPISAPSPPALFSTAHPAASWIVRTTMPWRRWRRFCRPAG